MSDIERSIEESKTMNTFCIKILSKIPMFGNMTRGHLKPRSFRSSTTQDIMVDTFKFTSKSKVRNNFCAGCSIRKMPRHLSPDLYSGTSKGPSVGDLVDGH